MRGFEAKKNGKTATGRRGSSCSYCRSKEHQVTGCPHIVADWSDIQTGRMPISRAVNYLPRWMTNGTEWGNWYKSASRAHGTYANHQMKLGNNRGKKRARRNVKCGFCGDTQHTRRTCSRYENLLQKCNTANRVYRSQVYEKLVKEQGLSTGCILGFNLIEGTSYTNTSKKVAKKVSALCTSVNWDSINFFAEYTSLSYNERNKAIRTHSLDVGEARLDNLQTFVKSGIFMEFHHSSGDEGKVHYRVEYGKDMQTLYYNHYSRYAEEYSWSSSYGKRVEGKVKIVSPAPQILDEKWVDGYQDAFKLLLSKFTLAELTATGIVEHIEEWVNKAKENE